jgi:hypothetical protein
VVDERSEPRRLCTIAARNYAASVLVLVRTFAAHHPDVPVTVLFVDAGPDDGFPDYPCEVLAPESLPIDRDVFLRMATYYDVTELSTALKPLLLRHLLQRGTASVMYLDPDIEVFAPLDDLFDLATARQTVLTPHVLRPMPRDGLSITEEVILASGQFNLGFLAVGQGAAPFLDYWWERTRLYALSHEEGYFTDQRWVDAVPVFFEHAICRDTACNVAYWNLHERTLDVDEHDRWTVDGAPLRFFHYSGHDASEPTRLSRHVVEPERIDVAEHPALARLLRERSARINAVDVGETPPYRWKRTADGLELKPIIRSLYWDAVRTAEEHNEPPPPHAFDADRGVAFTDWLLSPVEPGVAVTRFQHAVWRDNPHFQRMCPDPLGADAEHFVELTRIDVTLTLHKLMPRALRPSPCPDGFVLPGVNLVGYLDGEFGVAAHGRVLARMVRASGVPMATTVLRPPEQQHRHHYPTTIEGAPFGLGMLAMNADGLLQFARSPGFAPHRDRPRVGVWAWEAGPLPEEMRPAYDVVDEVWCASDHTRSALAGCSDRPIVKHPLAIGVPIDAPAVTRRDLGLPEAEFLFGFVFDYRSVLARKNPLGLVTAYRRAFGPDDGAALVLKTINASSAPDHEALVETAVAGRSDIQIVDRHLDEVEMRALFHLLDCYVSLHRSEGVGLTIAAAMAAGTPAIATGWSGNLEFMDDDAGVLVPSSLVEVGPDAWPYLADSSWADPDLDAAADAMRRLFDDPELARDLGARGRAHIAAVGDVQRAARWFTDRFAEHTGLEVRVA